MFIYQMVSTFPYFLCTENLTASSLPGAAIYLFADTFFQQFKIIPPAAQNVLIPHF
jgi:hypothetical protein